MTSAAWWPGNALGFDTETTGPEPTTARIVSATCVEVGASGVVKRESWLVNPGIPIPPEATAIHKITDLIAAAGFPTAEAAPAIAASLRSAWARGLPVIAMNASYDLTLLEHELARLGLQLGELGPVLDPLVIDRGVDKFRKGKRKLEDLAKHYQVKIDGAHSSDGDALTAARVVWRQARTITRLQSYTLEKMQKWQREAHEAWAHGYEQHLRKTNPAAIIDRSWPIRRAA